ncbi:hypothetical protein N825_04220 [Skermanella stibiiresistens SB22]|uniref:DUF1398 domain-containing protein n=1 Tax=Skermanella stibiiresistens SB22 TaxID=1385369 RepID=W9H4W2_9PROT|nr:hypothetical protein [Skermanella stibiiresistens]EWY39732.1 hypothetical protein N825_04220 [Skermanella stibiiresistens SB22]
MDARRIIIAEECQKAAHDGTMAFPDIVGSLIQAGFEGYAVDYRRDTTTYFLPDGEGVVLGNQPSEGAVAATFDEAGIAAQVRWAQANPPEYAYAAFCRNVKAFGCAGYMVSFPGRRVLYFGRTAETHVEHFPGD